MDTPITRAEHDEFRRRMVDKNMPEWARPTVQKLVDKGFLKGDGGGLGLTDGLLRILVINDRAGLYDRVIVI